MSKRTGVTDADARAGAGAVLRESLGEEEYRHLTGQLPTEYTGLVETAS